MRSRVP